MKQQNYFFLNSQGNLLPWGEFCYAQPFRNGVCFVREKKDGFLLNETGEIISERIPENYWLPDGVAKNLVAQIRIYTPELRALNGVYDFSRNRSIIPLQEGNGIFPHYIKNDGSFFFVRRDNKLNKYSADGELLTSYPTKKYCSPLFCGLDEEESAFIEYDTPTMLFGTPNTTPLYVRNGDTGEEITTFLCIAPCVEGVRYMMNSRGEESFLRKDFTEAFKLPYPTNNLQYGNMGAENRSWYCRDGRIPLNSWKSKGRKMAYLIDKQGNIVIEPGKYTNILHTGSQRLLLKKGSNYAMSDLDGNLLTDFVYSDFRETTGAAAIDFPLFFGELLPLVKKVGTKKQMCALNRNGEEVIPPEYSQILSRFIYTSLSIPYQASNIYTVKK